MANFACQNRDDERYLMDELKRANLSSIKVIVVTQDINTQIGSETANLGQFGVVANLNEVRTGVLKRVDDWGVLCWQAKAHKGDQHIL